ncbi:MAG: hypothetical protein ACKVKL_06170 [Pseudomonadales bacterium]|jgi:hypothetical protein|tara:strand:+ start:1130 stop:1489 length:360 start_codon:yes stop_codon:yes gene_type:complete
MTEFETAELTFSLVGYGMTAMALYFTVVSGYLIVAYLVGEQLSKSQMIIVSSLFSVLAFSLVFGSYSFFAEANRVGSVTASSVEYWLAAVIGLAELAGIISAFKFMFDIRKKAAAVHSD